VQYQLIQHEADRFELRLVTVDRETYQQVIGGILEDLQNLLGKSAIIDSQYHPELQRHEGGKFRPVILELRSENFELRSKVRSKVRS
jgi:hypothetical protein